MFNIKKLSAIIAAVFLFCHLTITASAAYDCTVTSYTDEISQDNLRYISKTAYISGMDNTEGQSTVNSASEEIVRLYQLKAKVKAEKGQSVDGTLNFDIARNSGGITSIKYYETENGNITDETGMTFDCSTGRIYLLNELFRQDSGWKKHITDSVRSTAQENGWTDNSDKAEVSELSEYYLTEDMLVLIFNREQTEKYFEKVGNRAVEAEIPLSELKFMLKAELSELMF